MTLLLAAGDKAPRILQDISMPKQPFEAWPEEQLRKFNDMRWRAELDHRRYYPAAGFRWATQLATPGSRIWLQFGPGDGLALCQQ